jgi:hypothetical protein
MSLIHVCPRGLDIDNFTAMMMKNRFFWDVKVSLGQEISFFASEKLN